MLTLRYYFFCNFILFSCITITTLHFMKYKAFYKRKCLLCQYFKLHLDHSQFLAKESNICILTGPHPIYISPDWGTSTWVKWYIQLSNEVLSIHLFWERGSELCFSSLNGDMCSFHTCAHVWHTGLNSVLAQRIQDEPNRFELLLSENLPCGRRRKTTSKLESKYVHLLLYLLLLLLLLLLFYNEVP